VDFDRKIDARKIRFDEPVGGHDSVTMILFIFPGSGCPDFRGSLIMPI
jgi:hypothetical protein